MQTQYFNISRAKGCGARAMPAFHRQDAATALAIASVCLLGAGAFVLPVKTPAPYGTLLANSEVLPGRSTFSSLGGTSSARSRGAQPMFPPLALGAMLATAFACRRDRRSRSGSTAQPAVTYDMIDRLTVEDMPAWFRPKITCGMARRNQTKEAIKQCLDDTFFLMAFNKDKMNGAELTAAREMFPSAVVARCLKNTLVRKAVEGTEWEQFAPLCKGANMFVFVKKDTDLKGTIEAYLKIEKAYKRAERCAEFIENNLETVIEDYRPLRGGMMRDEWNIITPEELPKFKDFPTKTELIAKIAGGIKQVTTKIAKGVKQVPTKLAVGTKKITEQIEEDGKATVAEVVV